jgi:hypothetical protein
VSLVQVEAVRQSAVYSCACKLLLRMTAAWVAFTIRALNRARDANPTKSQRSPSLIAADRLFAGLRLLVASCAWTVDKNALAMAVDDLSTLSEELAAMPAAVSAEFIRQDYVQPSVLPEAQLVRGCKMFAPWEPPPVGTSEPVMLEVVHCKGEDVHAHVTEGVDDQGGNMFGISGTRLQALAKECKALADLARSVTWHADTAACGPTLMKAAEQLADAVQSRSEGSTCVSDENGADGVHGATRIGEHAVGCMGDVVHAAPSNSCTHHVVASDTEPFATTLAQPQPAMARSCSSSDDNLDEVVMKPGPGWGGVPSCADRLHTESVFSSPRREDMALGTATGPKREEVGTLRHATPPREHESLAAELHLPSSLQLGEMEQAGNPWHSTSRDDRIGTLSVVEHLSLADTVGLPRFLELESSMAAEGEADDRAADADFQDRASPSLDFCNARPTPESRGHSGSVRANGGAPAFSGDALEIADAADVDSESSDAAADPYTKELHERELLHLSESHSLWSGNHDIHDMSGCF